MTLRSFVLSEYFIDHEPDSYEHHDYARYKHYTYVLRDKFGRCGRFSRILNNV